MSIFISVASYRDKVCNSTVKSAFDNAENPAKVFVGICQQNKPEEDSDCALSFETNPNVRIIRIPYYEAKGPTYARYLCSTLWNGEDYFLQVDSHSKFVKNWDTQCIKMIGDIKAKGLSEKPVLSHYPKAIESYTEYSEANKTKVPRICKSFFNDRGMVSFMGAEEIDSKGEYYRTPYVSGGMLFAESKFLKELPYDPHLPFLFVGEEILHSVRFYTNGWDCFTPSSNIVFHEYTRADKPKIWTDNPTYRDDDAFNKVKQYLHLLNADVEKSVSQDVSMNMDKYGLGKARSLQDYYQFAGINVEKKEVTTNFCRANNEATAEDIRKSSEDRTRAEGFQNADAKSLLFSETYPRLSSGADTENPWLYYLVFALFIAFIVVAIYFAFFSKGDCGSCNVLSMRQTKRKNVF
jgi:hypothetical protein